MSIYVVQEVVNKTITKKKKSKKTKWLSKEAFRIAEERREAKRKKGKVNAEFQRIASREKAFFNEQCNGLEECKRREKTRDLFKKVGNIKGTFHPKISTIKDRNGKDIAEAEEIKRRWKEYIEELHKKDLNNPDNHDGVVVHPEPDILECGVKWALGSTVVNKASGGDGITAELFKILKDDSIKVLHSICQQIWKTQQLKADISNRRYWQSVSSVTQSCPMLCDSMNCCTPDFPVNH